MKKLRVVLSLMLAFVLTLSLLSGCTSKTKQQSSQQNSTSQASKNKNFKVGLVTDVGGINDHSFNQLAYQGLEKAKNELGVTVNVIQSKQLTDYVTNLTQFAQQKYNLVIAVGYLMKDAVEQVSKEFPDTKFLIIDSDITDRPNVASATFKTEQCGYLVGVMAGLMEKEKNAKLNDQNVVGVIGGMQIPPVDSYIAGFQQGVKAVNPDAKVLVSYTGKFDDPASGKQMALTQISQGADIVFPIAGQTGDGVINAAKEKNIYAIGVDADQNYVAPDTVMTSALKKVDTATFDIIKSVLDNNFKSGLVYFDLANEGVGYAKPIKDVPQSIVDKVDEYAKQIKDGTIKVSDQVQK
ncbi:BMP family ABC transporter substrate-binding protein [Thermoanaerobacterium thermosaccharolyticum]|uniref:BMP family lipoprotein n=1 Tax=Thermoanaerobacterium thermosaccharolyticum TaxID=1517 RepID=UPI000C074BFD|nr:BMP family ABC transporter substrate-binding protein [Thermoanaerobacterium thermosaccharolyticum]PHO07946.1 BMP family ABC transporter substrate-binding protein [Thermoanaerobacterium thermosaccharolyticum]